MQIIVKRNICWNLHQMEAVASRVDYHMENAYSFAFHHGSLYYISRETDPETLIGTETVKRLELGEKRTRDNRNTFQYGCSASCISIWRSCVYSDEACQIQKNPVSIIYDTKTSRSTG